MEAWIDFWTLLLVASLGGFALLVTVVAVGGYRDLRKMLRALGEQDREGEEVGSD